MYYQNLKKLIHCFGNERNIINVEEVANMIEVSKINLIPINTHKVFLFNDWKDVHIGYGNANWNNLSKIINLDGKEPVWNINLPTSSEEAIKRIDYIVGSWGKKAIKLEVLTPDFRESVNKEVIKVVEHFKDSDLEIWPLLTPDYEDAKKCIELDCKILRIMGTPIASGNGLTEKTIDVVRKLKQDFPDIVIMLDGGIGTVEDFKQSIDCGCDCVLVNSCLFFDKNKKPHEKLKEFVEAENFYDC